MQNQPLSKSSSADFVFVPTFLMLLITYKDFCISRRQNAEVPYFPLQNKPYCFPAGKPENHGMHAPGLIPADGRYTVLYLG